MADGNGDKGAASAPLQPEPGTSGYPVEIQGDEGKNKLTKFINYYTKGIVVVVVVIGW